MNISFVGRRLKLNQNFKDYASEKLAKLDKLISQDISTEQVEVEIERNTHHLNGGALTCQITMRVDGRFLRAENTGDELNEVFDLAFDRVRSAFEKHKSKKHSFTHKFRAVVSKKKSKDIIRRKQLEDLKPMTESEAIAQLELLNHDFLVYMNESGKITTLYRRKNGGYGVIET